MTPRELAEVEGKPIALGWIDAALAALRAHLDALVVGEAPGPDDVVTAALATNFSLGASSGIARIAYVWLILGTFTRARDVIVRSDRFFSSVTLDEARALFPAGAAVPPAYAMFGHGVFFTPCFAPYDAATGSGFGPRCRAAMVVHESVHVVDSLSGRPDVHVSEWQEPAFSAQTPWQSVHNPSAYASFAAQVASGALAWPPSARYGA
ncbi:MAG: hypothetical protein KIS78_30465, partial [Labilithrix sp.]|nr:hypothetical protein [Labilithrix sp.]